MQLFLKSANRSDANSWAYSAIANSQLVSPQFFFTNLTRAFLAFICKEILQICRVFKAPKKVRKSQIRKSQNIGFAYCKSASPQVWGIAICGTYLLTAHLCISHAQSILFLRTFVLDKFHAVLIVKGSVKFFYCRSTSMFILYYELLVYVKTIFDFFCQRKTRQFNGIHQPPIMQLLPNVILISVLVSHSPSEESHRQKPQNLYRIIQFRSGKDVGVVGLL
jgi:hypothetical protein